MTSMALCCATAAGEPEAARLRRESILEPLRNRHVNVSLCVDSLDNVVFGVLSTLNCVYVCGTERVRIVTTPTVCIPLKDTTIQCLYFEVVLAKSDVNVFRSYKVLAVQS